MAFEERSEAGGVAGAGRPDEIRLSDHALKS
jgi:hypothetical protein